MSKNVITKTKKAPMEGKVLLMKTEDIMHKLLKNSFIKLKEYEVQVKKRV